MKRFTLACFSILFFFVCSNGWAQITDKKDYSSLVNPFVGTGGHGHTFPGATAPFGMVQLSPDTRVEGWDGCSGYHYSDSIIYGFSHTHLSGTGVPDYCDILLVPQTGSPRWIPGHIDPINGYGDRFKHSKEKASPGFYEVDLLNQGINVQLTVSQRCGFHKYTFQKKGKKFVLIDLNHRDKLLRSSMSTLTNKSLSGFRVSESWASEQHVYFNLECSIPFKKIHWNKDRTQALLEFPASTKEMLIKIGLSGVDEKGAENNLAKEIPHWDFESIRNQVQASWNSELGRIHFESFDPEIERTFYTGLYHTFIQPNVFSDLDGRYRGRDQQIHSITDSIPQYTVFSLWDTYRAAHPLYSIVQQKRTGAFINTFLRQYEEGGDLPVWELAGNETECMIGYHSVSVIADSWVKNIRSFDGNKALAAMDATAKFREFGKHLYRENGFLSSGDEPESVSKTLEYAYDDFCIAIMATSLGRMDVYQPYYKSCYHFVNSYDPTTKFMRARRGAQWHTPFNPAEVNFNYTEANSWQYSLYAPHAIDVLSKLMGGKDSLETWLDRLFATNSGLSGREQVDITGLIGQYAHGNEPSHHMAYLYNYTNTSHKTALFVDSIQKTMYHNLPDGLSGNEDCGQMSAWYVLSALGFYQVAPAHAWYDFGRPLITKASIQLENGKSLNINVLNNNERNKYIQQIRLNGQEYNATSFHHSKLMEGGEWTIEMGPNPSDHFPIFTSNSALNEELMMIYGFVASPFITTSERVFEDSLLVDMGMHPSIFLSTSQIEYRWMKDTNTVFKYEKPFYVHETSEIQLRRKQELIPVPHSMPMMGDYDYSPWTNATFTKQDKNVELVMNTEYSPQYAASGPKALIDGIRGGNEFRTGDYQGYWATDVVAEVTFKEARELTEIGISCIQDMKSWIFFPKEIQLEISFDGKHFQALKSIYTNFPYASNAKSSELIPSFSSYAGPMHAEFYRKTDSDKAVKKIRIKALNYGKCPEWHLGKGNDTWLFLDELIIR
jgi:predicted alpha-1,2-mannosidase